MPSWNFRVPLLNPVLAVIYQLDIQATWGVDPPGDADTGYDYIYREPIVDRSSGSRSVTRVETGPVKIPCQVETQSFEQLQAAFGGDNAATDMAFVTHRQDLEALGLLSAVTGRCSLKPGDRIASIEKSGATVRTFSKELYIYEVRPRSWGFGPAGYDLEILYTTYRSADPRRP